MPPPSPPRPRWPADEVAQPATAVAAPAPEPSAAVRDALRALQPRLPLDSLHANLRTLSDTLARTLSHTPAFPALQTRLQTAALAAAHLLEKTRSALAHFRAAASKNVDDVTLVLDLLSEDLRAPAETLLSASAACNARLAAASHDLALAFEAAAEDVHAALTHAITTHAEQQRLHDALHSATAESYLALSRARHEHASAALSMSEAAALYAAAQRRERLAQRRGHVLHAAHVSAVVASFLTTRSATLALSVTGAAALAATTDAQVARAREERAVHLRHRNDARDQRADARRAVAELGERLRHRRREELVAADVLNGLADCVDALRKLAGVMLVVEAFWREVADGVDGGVAQLVSVGVRLPDEERLAFWDGHTFRRRVERDTAFWTAVRMVCDVGLAGVSDVGLPLCDGSEALPVSARVTAPQQEPELLPPPKDGSEALPVSARGAAPQQEPELLPPPKDGSAAVPVAARVPAPQQEPELLPPPKENG